MRPFLLRETAFDRVEAALIEYDMESRAQLFGDQPAQDARLTSYG